MKEKSLIARISEEEKGNQRILSEIIEEQRKENIRINDNKDFERLKFEEFKRIVKGKKYFRMKHIDALNLPYDICIHLSAKGSGKTTEIFRMIDRVLEKGEKFMYGRVQMNELEREVEEFIMRDESNVYPIKYNGNGYFYTKKDVNEYIESTAEEIDGEIALKRPNVPGLRSHLKKFIGKGYSFLSSNALSGGNYEGYKTIFFDEILSYAPAQRVNELVLKAGDASVHTIQRNKKGLKIYLFGNMQNVPSHPLLKHYGIDVDDDLRYIERIKKGKVCRILYINSKGLYGGTIGNSDGAAMHTNVENSIFLKHNKVIKPTPKILTPDIYGKMKHVGAIALKIRDEPYYVELREISVEDKPPYSAIKCEKLKISTTLDESIYTTDPCIYNKFSNVEHTYSIDGMYNEIYGLFRRNELYFATIDTLENYVEFCEYNSDILYENQPVPSVLCL